MEMKKKKKMAHAIRHHPITIVKPISEQAGITFQMPHHYLSEEAINI